MPSIRDIANKSKNKMFKQANNRHLEDILPFTNNEIMDTEREYSQVKANHGLEEAIDCLTDTPLEIASYKTAIENDDVADLARADLVFVHAKKKEFVKIDYRPWDDDKPVDRSTIVKESPSRIITSLYGVQRNIIKFLIENIDYEDTPYIYTFPIDIRSIVMFTSSSKFTVETSIRRLKEKKIIETWDHKRGRGGYVTFRIPSNLRDEFLNPRNRPIQPI